jgi:hypothetical protein
MNYPRVVAICGHMQAGKDSVGKILVSKYGYKRIGLADKVRELALEIDPEIFSDDDDHVCLSYMIEHYGWERSKKNEDVRRILQQLGTGARNILGKDVWIRPVLDELKTHPNDKYVITDIRFWNEAQAFTGYGEIWKVTRLGFNGDEHPSEKEVDLIKFDRLIDNCCTLAELETLVDLIMGSYK